MCKSSQYKSLSPSFLLQFQHATIQKQEEMLFCSRIWNFHTNSAKAASAKRIWRSVWKCATCIHHKELYYRILFANLPPQGALSDTAKVEVVQLGQHENYLQKSTMWLFHYSSLMAHDNVWLIYLHNLKVKDDLFVHANHIITLEKALKRIC